MSKHQAFVEYFTHEFMEELWYLQKLARGDIPKRKEANPWETFFNVTQALLSLAPIPGLPLGFLLSKELVKKCIEYGGKALDLVQKAQGVGKDFLDKVDEVQGIYNTLTGKSEFKGLLQQEGPMDLIAIRVLVELLGRGLAERYEHVLTEYLGDPPAEGQVPLARVAARRIFEYLQSEPLLKHSISNHLLAQRCRLLNGVVLGKAKESWRERFVDTLGKPLPRLFHDMHKVTLPLKAPFKGYLTGKFTAEGVLTRSAWYDAKQIYSHPKTEWQTPEGKPEQPKYGYAYLAIPDPSPVKDLKSDLRHCLTPPRDWRYYHPVSLADIQDYLKSAEIKIARAAKTTASMSFHDFLSKRKPKALQAVCHDDLTAIKDWSFGNFSGVDFSGAQITGDVSGAGFSGAYLVGMTAKDLRCTEESPVDFSGASLGFADFRKAKLPKAQFTQADLSLTNLSDADLTAIQSEGTNWYKTDLSGVKREDLWKKQAEQVKAAQAEFNERMTQLDERMNALESKVTPMLKQLQALEEQKPKTGEEIKALADKVSGLQIELTALANSDFVESCTAELKALRRDVDEVRGDVGVLHLRVDQIEAHLSELKALKSQVTVTLTKTGDVGRKILVEHTAVQLSHHVKDLEFYLPPTVINKLPEKLTLDELMVALNHPKSAETKTTDPEQKEKKGHVEDKKDDTATIVALPERFDAIEVIDKFLAADESLLLLLGEPGAGKSLSVWQATRRLLERFQPEMSGEAISGCWLPVIIELNSFKVSELEGLIDRELKGNYGLDDKAIAKLKQTAPDKETPEPKVLLMLDGYDELIQAVSSNRCDHSELFRRLGGLAWRTGQLKVIVTCRRRFLADEIEERMIFGVDNYQRYQRYELLPFTQEQIGRYVHARSQSDKGGGLLKPEVYLSALRESESVNQLVSNPFVLQLFLESLPRLKQDRQDITDLSRFVLYRAFFDQWIEREVRRLTSTKKAVLGRDSDVALVKDFQRMAKYLAMSLYAQNRLTVQFVKSPSINPDYAVWQGVLKLVADEASQEYKLLEASNSESEDDIFGLSTGSALPDKASFMRQTQARASQLVDILPLSRSGDCYQFVHKSFYEYLVTASIVDLMGEDKPLETVILKFFKQRLIQTEPAVLDFLYDLMSKHRSKPDQERRQALSQALYKIVERSRDEPQLGQASSNAATILNYCDISLIYRSWEGVQIPGADLSYGVLYGSNLSGANLEGADIHYAILGKVKFIGANLTNVRSGERPWVKFPEAVRDIALHPSKSWLAAGQEENVVLMDYETGAQVGVLKRREEWEEEFEDSDSGWNWMNSVAFSPDGRLLASGNEDKHCRLWNVESRKLMATLVGHTAGVRSVAFSRDGRFLASGSDDKSCRIWDVGSGKLIDTFAEYTDSVTSVAFSPDGRLLASGSEDGSCRLWLWEMKSLHTPVVLEHEYAVYGIAFSPDSRLLALGGGNSCQLWDIESQRLIAAPLVRNIDDCVTGVAFSPDGHLLASGSQHGSCQLWEVRNQNRVGQPLTGHKGRVSVAFSMDSRLLLSGNFGDSTCRLWETVSQFPLAKPLKGNRKYGRSLSFSPDGRLAALNGDIWELESQKLIGTLGEYEGYPRIESVAFSPDGRLLASGMHDGSCWLWEMEGRKLMCILGRPISGAETTAASSVRSVAFSSDGCFLASCNRYGNYQQWEVKSGKLITTLSVYTESVQGIALSSDAGLLISWGMRGMRVSEDTGYLLWDMREKRQIGQLLKEDMKAVDSVAFSPDGSLLALVGSCNYFYLCDIQEKKLHTIFWPFVHGSIYTLPAFSSDSRILILADDKNCHLWDVTTKAFAYKTTLNWVNKIYTIAFRPNKTSAGDWQLAVGDECGLISIWRINKQSFEFHLVSLIRNDQMPLDVTGADFTGCQMSAMTRRLFEQRGGKMDGVKIVEIKESEKDQKKSSGIQPASASQSASTSSSSSSTASSTSSTIAPPPSALQKKLQELCDKSYTFISKRSQENSLTIQITELESALAADEKEIRKELTSLVKLLQQEVAALGINSPEQYQVKPNWKDWSLQITAEASILDKIAGLLQTASMAYFPSVTAARAGLFYPAKPLSTPEAAPTVTCVLQ